MATVIETPTTPREADFRYQALNQAFWLAFSISAAAAEAIRPLAEQAYRDYMQAFKVECAARGGVPLPTLTDEDAPLYGVTMVVQAPTSPTEKASAA